MSKGKAVVYFLTQANFPTYFHPQITHHPSFATD